MKSSGAKKRTKLAAGKSQQKITRRSDSNGSGLRVSASARPLITLLTDFGTQDYFVAAMKGVILEAIPAANIVDITHDIPPQDIEAAAFTLLAAYASFRRGTIHVAVIDPGVGSDRRALLIQSRDQYFIGPDNGLFSWIVEGSDARIFNLNKPQYFRQPVSETFNGRDVFAPVAAALANGIAPAKLGTEVQSYVRLPTLKARREANNLIRGRIVHIDHFGNCVTSITAHQASSLNKRGARLTIGKRVVDKFVRYFSEADNEKEVFAYPGSAGFLEIGNKNGSAAKTLSVRRGDVVIMRHG